MEGRGLSESKVVTTRRRDAVEWGEGVGLRSVAQIVVILYLESAPLNYFVTKQDLVVWCPSTVVRLTAFESQTDDLFPEETTSCDLADLVCRIYKDM